jgi:hypothetical protein
MVVVQEFSDLPLTIDWLPHDQAASFLGIHISQYRRDLALLNDLGLIQRKKYGKGSDRVTLELLQEFRQLVKERGRYDAALEIIIRRK